MSGPDRLSTVADVQLHVWRQSPLMHATHRDASDVRILLDLEYVGECVRSGIGRRLERDWITALDGKTQINRRISFERVREQLHDHFEQLTDSRACPRRREYNGNQMPLAQGLLEGLM